MDTNTRGSEVPWLTYNIRQCISGYICYLRSLPSDRQRFLYDKGFVSGNVHTDAFAVRLFAAAGQEMIVACSFAKNFGLYGERVGVLHVVMSSEEPAAAVASQVFIAIYDFFPYNSTNILVASYCKIKLQHLSCAWSSNCRYNSRRFGA